MVTLLQYRCLLSLGPLCFGTLTMCLQNGARHLAAQPAEASKQLGIPMAELERYTALELPDVG